MAYSEAAIALRRCTATTKAGEPCRGWALWGDPQQRCGMHAGRAHIGPQRRRTLRWQRRKPTIQPCRCAAYNWPHRPGAGLCDWPHAPTHRLTTPAHSHQEGAVRRRRGGYEHRGGRYQGGHVERVQP